MEHERAIRRVGQLPVVVRYPGQLEEREIWKGDIQMERGATSYQKVE